MGMTDAQYEEKLKELQAHYAIMAFKDSDLLVANYEAISKAVGLQTPEDHAEELFLATSADTWVRAYIYSIRRLLMLGIAQCVALGVALYVHASDAALMLTPVAVTVAFTLLTYVMSIVVAVGAKHLHDARSAVVQEYIEAVTERSKVRMDQRIAEAKAKKS